MLLARCYFCPRCALVGLRQHRPSQFPVGAVTKSSRDMWKVVELVRFVTHGKNFRPNSGITREEVHCVCYRKGEYDLSIFWKRPELRAAPNSLTQKY